MSLKSRIERKIHVGNRTLGMGEPIFLTAEIGAAHCGSIENAKIMIKAAADAGCDGCDIFMCSDYAAEFYHRNTKNGHNFVQDWHDLYFTPDQWRELIAYGEANNVIVYPTPLDRVSLRVCRELGVKMINVNSDDVNNILFLEDAGKLEIPVTMHDIDQTISEVEGAVKTLIANGAAGVTVLHSTLETGDDEYGYATANLEVIRTYDQAFGALGALAGCVEHTTSDFLIYAVAAYRPVLISKHIQIDNSNPHDTSISVKTADLKRMIKNVRMVEKALGDGQNQRAINADGSIPMRSRNKVLVAARDIPAGKVVTRDDIDARRPGDYGGLHPWNARLIVGAKTTRALKRNEILSLNMFSDFPDVDYKFPETHDYKLHANSKVVAV